MKTTVRQLQHRWYGLHYHSIATTTSNTSTVIVLPVNCAKLIKKSIHMINTKFIPLCNNVGISGVIGDLEVENDDNCNDNITNTQYLINLLINRIRNIEEE